MHAEKSHTSASSFICAWLHGYIIAFIETLLLQVLSLIGLVKSILDLLHDTLLLPSLVLALNTVVTVGASSSRDGGSLLCDARGVDTASSRGRVVVVPGSGLTNSILGKVAFSTGKSRVSAWSIGVTLEVTGFVAVSASLAALAVATDELIVGSGELELARE
jgi:hypothetical protein